MKTMRSADLSHPATTVPALSSHENPLPEPDRNPNPPTYRKRVLSRLNNRSDISFTFKQAENMIKNLLSGNLATENINEINKHAATNPEPFRQVISEMIKKNNGSETSWEQAIKIAETLSLPKSSRNSSEESFADELKMEITTQRFIRDLTWQVKNSGFGEEDFLIANLDFRKFLPPRNPSVTENALKKVITPDGPFGSFGLDLALKFTADMGLEPLHAKFCLYKDTLVRLRLGGGKVDYRAGTDNYAQNDIRHIISFKVSARNPAYNTLIQLFMMPNSLLPDDQAKRAFLKDQELRETTNSKEIPDRISNDSPFLLIDRDI